MLVEMFTGLALLVVFVIVEMRVKEPMFRLPCSASAPFTAGILATLLSSLGRGGLMFMLIIWLQGIWLPLHGYSFSQTPLWAGIYMLPLHDRVPDGGAAFAACSPIVTARGPFATGGMLMAALSFILLEQLPVDFPTGRSRALCLLIGLAWGCSSRPTRPEIMNSLPADQRGAGAGMTATFQLRPRCSRSGIFFSLMIVGLASALPPPCTGGWSTRACRPTWPTGAHLAPPAGGDPLRVFLGYNPMKQLLGPSVLAHSAATARGLPDRACVLPAAHLRAIPPRPAHGVRLRHRRLPARRGRIVAAQQPLRARPARRAGVRVGRGRGRADRRRRRLIAPADSCSTARTRLWPIGVIEPR